MQEPMSGRQAFAMNGKRRGHLRLVEQRPGTHSDANDRRDDDWLFRALAPNATFRGLMARTEMFADGETLCASGYHLVVSGELLAVRKRPGRKPVVRCMTAGDLFSLACDNVHMARCYAVRDSTVFQIRAAPHGTGSDRPGADARRASGPQGRTGDDPAVPWRRSDATLQPRGPNGTTCRSPVS